MPQTPHSSRRKPRAIAWAQFLIGVTAMTALVFALMQGYTPPGQIGDVFRNNMRCALDATPLFYTDVESLAPD